MAHTLSSKKRIRQNAKRHARNKWRLRTMRGALKAFQEHALHGSYAETEAAFKTACKVLDRTAQKGVIHKNQAARRKSRLSARLLAKKNAGK